MYNIAVLIKQVPVSNDVEVDPNTHALIRSTTEGMINPADLNAIEFALNIKEEKGANVVVYTMGPEEARKSLIEAMAMGCDESVFITDRVFAGGDTVATAKVLSKALSKQEGLDLILCGSQSADGATGQVGPMIAEFMDIAHVSDANSVSIDDSGKVNVVKKYSGKSISLEIDELSLVSVLFGSNIPRLTTLRTMRQAKKKNIEVLTNNELEFKLEDVGLAGSPTIVRDSFVPEVAIKAEIIRGSGVELAKKLEELLEKGN